MTGIIKDATYLTVSNLLSTKFVPAAFKPRTHEEIILDNIRDVNPHNADALAKRLQDDKQTIEQLRSCKVSYGESRKASSREKIERIKEQIKMLRLMGGDPKMFAKQIARLAKELAAAAQEYTSGAGGASQNLTEMNDSTNEMNSSPTSSNVIGESPAALTSEVTTDISTKTGIGETSVTGRNKDDNPAQESEATVTGAMLAESPMQYQDAQREKIKADVEKYVAEIKKKFSEGDEKREVINDLRTLAAQLKEMARRIKKLLHQKGLNTENQDLTQTNQALAEVEKSIADITGNNTAIISVFS